MPPRMTPKSDLPGGDLAALNFFEDGSPFLKHPLLTPERTRAEVDGLLQMSGLAPGTRWLDVGCGFGRHSIELAGRGYHVTGIDAAVAMLAAARQKAAAAGVKIDLQLALAEEFVSETLFDAAICLFTSLGQVTEQGENSGLVSRAYAALKPDGLLVIELPQREPAVAALKPAEQFGEGSSRTEIERRYSPDRHIITETFVVTSRGRIRSFRLAYRLYSHAEVIDLLAAAGFEIIASYQDFSQTPLTNEAPRMIILGQKPGESR